MSFLVKNLTALHGNTQVSLYGPFRSEELSSIRSVRAMKYTLPHPSHMMPMWTAIE
jgi:hypothetical protein